MNTSLAVRQPAHSTCAPFTFEPICTHKLQKIINSVSWRLAVSYKPLCNSPHVAGPSAYSCGADTRCFAAAASRYLLSLLFERRPCKCSRAQQGKLQVGVRLHGVLLYLYSNTGDCSKKFEPIMTMNIGHFCHRCK